MEPVRILRLVVEDFMRIFVVDVTLDPNATEVVVAGENEQGKTSLLNAVETIVAGVGGATVNGAKMTDLVRHGAGISRLRADFGNENGRRYIVERSISVEGKPTLKIKGANGVKLASTQAFMDDLSGRLGLDPGAFIAMGASEQFDEVCRIAGLDFAEIDAANEVDFEKRRQLNAAAKASQAAADKIEVPVGLPKDRVQVTKLLDELNDRVEKNKAIAAEENLREEKRKEAERLRSEHALVAGELAAAIQKNETASDAALADIDEQIAALQARRKRVAGDAVRAKQLMKEAAEAKRQALTEKADAIDDDLLLRPALESEQETRSLQDEIENADAFNRGIELRDRRAELEAEARRTEKESDALTAAMDERNEKKRKMIADAKLPVGGIGFGPKIITLDDVPFKQGSDGRQWRAACEIAMAGARELRVLLIRRASLITAKNRSVIVETAKPLGFQVWFEFAQASSDAAGAIIMQEGRVKS